MAVLPPKKLRIVYKKISDGVYRAEHQCPPHVWYYVGTPAYWKCIFCLKIRRQRPLSGYFEDEIEKIFPKE